VTGIRQRSGYTFAAQARILCSVTVNNVERFDARTWPEDVLKELFAGAFPEFITADVEVKKYIGRVREWFTDLNIMLVDDQEVPVATGWGVPIRWNGELAGLPTGYTDTARQAVQGREHGETPDTFVDTFARWTRQDGAPLDPWLRSHWRLGGKIIATAPSSQTMTGTVSEWESWTGMVFPSTGDYVIPAGLSTLHIDREADSGRYVEPNVWVRHR
jgi:hypothetical protein